MPQTRINGATLAWQQLGHGPDVLFVHGLAANRAFWFAPYAVPLSRHCRVTLFDLRGHGYSERTTGGYSATAMAQDLLGLLDVLHIERPSVVAHSYGGGAALEFALAHPGRVAQLALFDTRVHRLQPTQYLHDCTWLSAVEKAIAATADHDWEHEPQIGFRFLEAAARWRVNHPGERLVGDFVPFGEGRGSQRCARDWLALLDNTSAAREFLAPGADADTIRKLATPLWLVYGEHSRNLPSLHGLQALLPTARVDIVAGAGHFFPISHHARVLPQLERFLGVSAVRDPPVSQPVFDL